LFAKIVSISVEISLVIKGTTLRHSRFSCNYFTDEAPKSIVVTSLFARHQARAIYGKVHPIFLATSAN